MEVITKEDGSTDASLAQICVLEDFMEVWRTNLLLSFRPKTLCSTPIATDNQTTLCEVWHEYSTLGSKDRRIVSFVDTKR